MILLSTMIVLSLASEFVANNRPYITLYKGNVFFPVLKNYPTAKFDYFSIRPDFRKICKRKNTSCIFPPVKYGPIEIDRNVRKYPAPPSLSHPMGLDSLGRDIFARMIYGLRISLGYAACVWLISFTVGTILGSCMGFFGGVVDLTLYRMMEVFFAIPYLIVLITLVSIFSPSISLLVIISSLFSWGYITRYMRSEFFKIRKLDYIQSAVASGNTTTKIIFRHILPNALTPLITFSPFFIAANILGLSSLDFLGLGVMPPTPSWGELLRQGKEYFLGAWYLAVFPAFGLFATLALINFVGEGIRDAFDPRRY